jgi:hypothetical protein
MESDFGFGSGIGIGLEIETGFSNDGMTVCILVRLGGS